ncbi:expressed unknown protein [Ectocarpus siliculosus]|uniref:Uncharacterized protein n=1 Tax=Ectocarpus siliculosus TaxID=2880 RepID=D7G0E6_ECTSI|nr:expressed unknown protein [Ectocarpus siliculosus]|eukprot:CBJ26673.1 expressed unknown protein [Ectocarpus siliculosus]
MYRGGWEGWLRSFVGLGRTGFRSTKQRLTDLHINVRVAVGANASESCSRTLRGTRQTGC